MAIKTYILRASILLASLSGCTSKNGNHQVLPSNTKFDLLINDYLEQRRIEPQAVFNVAEDKIIYNNLNIQWKPLDRGVIITINNFSINTNGLVTLNDVLGEGHKDSVNFANTLSQIKYYETNDDKLLGFVLTYTPCTGLGCGVNYQLIYDLKTQKVNSFGRFRTGFDLDLYDFDDNDKVDYLSKTFFGRNEQLRDTTVFTYYQQEADGRFVLSKSAKGETYYFKHRYSLESDTMPEGFEEKWVTSIKESR
ncbi:MAG TPA: hypothetical protein VD794_07710 [Flavisolibacter sp.]|nr:hypothetical protein [Flavisolibacter sp.]